MKTHFNSIASTLENTFRHLSAAAAFLVCGSGMLHAQQDLETSVPANWSAAAGTLSISPNHYKMGGQSLRWDWNAGSVITISNPGINAADVTDFYKNTCDFWVWNGTPVPGGKLRVEFMNGTTAQYWFDFYLDYTGWRRAVRSYRYDMAKKTSPSATFTSVRISAPASGSGSFYFDAMRWVGNSFGRIRDAQNVDIAGYSSSSGDFNAYAQVPDIAANPPTAAELADLATLRSRWLAAIKGSSKPSASSVTSAGTSFTAMNIAEDANGIRGQVIGDDTYALDAWALTLARDYAWNTTTATASRDKMLRLARHLMDQGHAANSNSRPGIWYDYVNIPNALTLMAPACDANTKAQLWDFFRWNFDIGEFWTTAWERNVDDIYMGVIQQLGAILFLTPDDAEAVRMLKGYKRNLERFLVASEGSEDGIKPDGTSFHHRSHYNGYMYAYKPLSSALYHLRGSGFQIDQPAYESLRKAIMTQMRMSADGTGGAGNTIGYFGNSHCGRKAFETNINFAQSDLRQLGELGGMILGQNADPVVARAYNRRYGVNDYALFTSHGVEDPPDGFLQFNYSPLGIYRRANWVASMRAPQRYFWSSEIFDDSNHYGRYQGYGALEILYHGGISMSGEQINGWDWNQPPGTTTIVLPDSKLTAIGSNREWETVRSQINFSGALAFRDGQSGLYAGNFQEKATSPNYNPTFKWRKSWFAFGSEIVCLGSNIENNDTVNRTVTTLFQGALVTQSTPITLDAGAITSFPHSNTASGASAHWLLDACGTGYVVPPGADVKISRATQTSANHTGSGSPTTGDFAKAWLDHGTAPNGAGYEYAVLPGTTAAAMTSAASQHADSATKPYQVIQRDSTAHVVKWKSDGKIGYAIFSNTTLPSSTKTAGLLSAVERPCLVMTQLGASDDAWVSVVDPDLNFSNPQAEYGLPDASVARTLDVTINGPWSLDAPDAGTSLVAFSTTSTTIRVTTQHGSPVHVHLKSNSSPGVRSWANLGNDWNDPVNWGANSGGALPANDTVTDIAALGAATVQPVLNGNYSVKGLTLDGGTTLSGTGALTLGAGGIVTTASANTISLSNLTLAASQVWNSGAGDLTVSSAIGGNTTATLTKSGAGTLTLSGSNNYLGGTIVSSNSGLVTVSGNQSAATGGWTINAGATVNFQAGSTVTVANGKSIQLVNASSAIHTLNAAGTVTATGSLAVHAGSILNVNSGGSWTQNGSMTIQPLSSYFTPVMNVNAGGSFTYAGTSAISLSSSVKTNGGSATLNLSGGIFTTGKNFNNSTASGDGSTTATGSAGGANLNFSNGGTLKLSADIASLATTAGRPFNIQIGTGGGVIDTNGFTTTLAMGIANVSGQTGSLTKQGAGTLTLTGTNTYTGGTTVSAGTLSVATAGFANASSVTIAAGAILNLNFAGSDSVAALLIGGTSLPPGTYSATTHPSVITGTGSLTVVSAAAPSGFASWAAANNLSGESEADTDQDGIADALEFVFGTDPQSATPSGISSQKTGDNLVFTFNRTDLSEDGGLQLVVEAGKDLQSWPQAFQIGGTTGTSDPGVSISENGDEPDTITVTIPTNGSATHYARLKVVTTGG